MITGAMWLFGPVEDLFFVANLTWPLVAAVVWLNRRWLDLPVELLLTGVIGTPHRWITLPLLANDRVRWHNRGGLIAAVGLATTAAFLGTWFWTRNLALLLLIRYLWNVWHVAAQNAGVTRIYELKAAPERRDGGTLEKWLLRGFMVFAFLRVAGIPATTAFDYPALLAPLALLVLQVRTYEPRLKAKYVHMAAALSNYLAMLFCAHRGLTEWGVAVSVANAVLHATEYFSIVTWSVRGRASRPEGFFWPAAARHWAVSLAVFLGLMALTSAFLATRFGPFWVLLNTLVSLLHYAWDGVIWKMPAVFAQASETRGPSRLQPEPRAA